MKSRLFVGIPLPADTIASLVSATDVLRSKDRSWVSEKWVAVQNLHVTVAFFGDVVAESIPSLAERIGEIVASSGPITLVPHAVSAIPSARRCRMLWASFLDENSGAASISGSVAEAADAFDIEIESKPFKAHVTLCRARRPHHVDSAALAAAELVFLSQSSRVSDPPVTLYSSRLTPRGPVYEEIATWHTLGECSP